MFDQCGCPYVEYATSSGSQEKYSWVHRHNFRPISDRSTSALSKCVKTGLLRCRRQYAIWPNSVRYAAVRMSNMQQVQGRRKNTVGYIDTSFGPFRTVLPVLCRSVLKLDCYDVGNSAQYGLTLSGVRSISSITYNAHDIFAFLQCICAYTYFSATQELHFVVI